MIPSAQGSRAEYSLLAKDTYPARLVGFYGIGVQELPPYQGKPKAPAFQGVFAFEIVGEEITVTKGDDVKQIPAVLRPKFNIFPGGERGKTFDLCAALQPGLQKVPGDLSAFKGYLNMPVAVTVGQYEGKQDGKLRNCVDGVAPMMRGMSVGEPQSELQFFDPYDGGEEMKKAYEGMLQYIRDMVGGAQDAEHIPFAGMEVVANDVAGSEAKEGDDDVY